MAEYPTDLANVDLSRHDFDALRDDINDIVDLPRAIGQSLRWMLLVPILGTWLTWVVFADRMAGWVRLPYVILVAVTLVIASAGIATLAVMRSRVVEVDEAADRVVLTVAAVHGDYVQITSGEADLPKQELASVLTREVVFPAMTAGGDVFFNTIPILSGPLGFVLRPLTKYPLAMIENRVLDVIQADGEPDEEWIPGAEPATITTSTTDSNQPELDVAELAETVLADLPPELEHWYRSIHRRLTQVVAGAGAVAVGSTGVIVAVAALPLAVTLTVGWLLT